MLTQKIRNLIEDAGRAQSSYAHTPNGCTEPTVYIGKRAAVSSVLSLNSDSLPGLLDANGRVSRTPTADPAATTTKLSAGIIAASRVAEAGAHVLVRAEPTKAHAVGKNGAVAVESVASHFRLVDPAKFVAVPDDEEIASSPFPVASAAIDWATSTTKGVRFDLRRSDMRDLGADFVADAAVKAIVLGLGRAADETLMSAIAATSLTSFSLSAAARKGLRFSELFGFVGPESIAGVVTEDGVLRLKSATGVDYVNAELSADLGTSIVGSWSRSGIAIHDHLPVHFERLNANGDLAITAWANFVPLVPNPTYFWQAE